MTECAIGGGDGGESDYTGNTGGPGLAVNETDRESTTFGLLLMHSPLGV